MKNNNNFQINSSSEVILNYEALEYLTWFMTDAQNVQNWAGSIFRGGFNSDDPRLIELLAAANKSIKEIEDDIAKLKEYLSQIIPVLGT